MKVFAPINIENTSFYRYNEFHHAQLILFVILIYIMLMMLSHKTALLCAYSKIQISYEILRVFNIICLRCVSSSIKSIYFQIENINLVAIQRVSTMFLMHEKGKNNNWKKIFAFIVNCIKLIKYFNKILQILNLNSLSFFVNFWICVKVKALGFKIEIGFRFIQNIIFNKKYAIHLNVLMQ